MNHNKLRGLSALVALTLSAGMAHASDAEGEFHATCVQVSAAVLKRSAKLF
jgi:hypothetical protein